jgi:hypothetical protein
VKTDVNEKVNPGSEEWKKVENRVRETLPNAKLVKVERVQNKWLWENYCSRQALLAKKTNGVVNELQVSH